MSGAKIELNDRIEKLEDGRIKSALQQTFSGAPWKTREDSSCEFIQLHIYGLAEPMLATMIHTVWWQFRSRYGFSIYDQLQYHHMYPCFSQ